MVKIKPKKKNKYQRNNLNDDHGKERINKNLIFQRNKIIGLNKKNNINSNQTVQNRLFKKERNKNEKRKKRTNIQNKRKKRFKTLQLISPFYISIESIFYYDLEEFTEFNKFTNDLNKYKLTKEELDKLIGVVDNINESNKKIFFAPSIKIIPELYENFKKLEVAAMPKNYQAIVIENIIADNFPKKNFSLRKIKNIYEATTKTNISISTNFYILKYILKLRYLKTVEKPKILSDVKYIRKSFFLIRLIYQVLINQMDIIYIDETKIQLKNSNFRMWRYKYDSFNYCSIKQDKINLILAVSKNDVVHYEFVKKNTDTNIFKNFIDNIIKKLPEKKIKTICFLF